MARTKVYTDKPYEQDQEHWYTQPEKVASKNDKAVIARRQENGWVWTFPYATRQKQTKQAFFASLTKTQRNKIQAEGFRLFNAWLKKGGNFNYESVDIEGDLRLRLIDLVDDQNAWGKIEEEEEIVIKKAGPKIKKPLTAFMYFNIDHRASVVNENPGIMFTEVGKKLGELWRQLDEEARAPYIFKADQDKKRYEAAVKEKEEPSPSVQEEDWVQVCEHQEEAAREAEIERFVDRLVERHHQAELDRHYKSLEEDDD